MSFGTQTGVETPPAPDKNRGRTGKIELQTYEEGRKSRNHPRPSWAVNHMGNPSVNIFIRWIIPTISLFKKKYKNQFDALLNSKSLVR